MGEEAPQVPLPLVDTGRDELLLAVTTDDIERARELISQRNCDPNVINGRGVSCLSLAVLNRNCEMVRLLLETGARLNAPLVYTEDSPINCCLRVDDPEIAQVLVNAGFSFQNLDMELAVRNGCINVIKFLLERGINVNTCDRETGSTMLHFAVLQNNTELIDLLIRWDANVNITDRHKQTPLEIAIRWNKVESMDLLLANGARMRSINDEKDSCLKAAFRRGRPDSIDCAIRHLAILESQGPFVDPDDYELIEQLNYSGARDYLNVCRNELQRAKSTLVLPLISVYDILVEKDKNRFVRDVKAFNAVKAYDPGNQFPMYDWLIKYGIYRFVNNPRDTVKPPTD